MPARSIGRAFSTERKKPQQMCYKPNLDNLRLRDRSDRVVWMLVTDFIQPINRVVKFANPDDGFPERQST